MNKDSWDLKPGLGHMDMDHEERQKGDYYLQAL